MPIRGSITFREVIRFLDEQRGQCWRECGLGVASVHDQWEPLINEAFSIFNSDDGHEDRQRKVLALLDSAGTVSLPSP